MKRLTLLLLLTATCFIFSCKKNSEKGEPVIPFGFKAFFSNGDSLVFKETITETNSFGRGGNAIDTIGTYFEIQSTFFTIGEAKVSLYFMETFPSEPSNSQREDIFHLGSYPFGRSDEDSLVDGVEVILRDTTGKMWSTANGNQSGSSFNITEHKVNDYDNFTPFMTTGDFQCILYDSLGNSLTISSGTFTGRTVVYPP